MQAYSMAAQAGTPFPLSVLFKLMHVDGKERILPEIQQFEMLQKQMQELAAQNEQLTQQNAELQQGLQNLQAANSELVESMQAEANGMRGAGGMYPTAGATDQVLPEGMI
jgi:FtsZ-binding cell division protein ZapB